MRICERYPGNRGHLSADIIRKYRQNQGRMAAQTSCFEDPRVKDSIHLYLESLNETIKSQEFTHPNLLAASAKLAKQTLFYTTNADKGGATVLWKRDDYEKEALRQLSDVETYDLVVGEDANFAEKVQSIVGKLVEKRNLLVRLLKICGCISHKEALAMGTLRENQQLPYVYFQPKIHKPKNPDTKTFESRAIVAANAGPISVLDKYAARLVAPILSKIPGTLKNSTDLLEKIRLFSDDQLQLNGEAGLTCCSGHEPSSEFIGFAVADVVALFPSIDLEAGLSAANQLYREEYDWLCCYYRKENAYPPVDPDTFLLILRFIMNNSYITYQQRRVYKQKKGIAMGSCISVFLANSFMYALTRNLIERPPAWLLMFQRYVDDCFFIMCFHPVHGPNQLDGLVESISTPAIKYVSKGNVFGPDSLQCDILDVSIFYDPASKTIQFQPYSKMCAAPSHIHRSSCTPPKVFSNIALSQMIRLKRLSSSRPIFLKAAKKLKTEFRLRGYSENEVFHAFRLADKNRHTSKARRRFNSKLRKPRQFYISQRYNPSVDWDLVNQRKNFVMKNISKYYALSVTKRGRLQKTKLEVVHTVASQPLLAQLRGQFKHGN